MEENIMSYLIKNGIIVENPTEKEILKALRDVFEKYKTDADYLEEYYTKHPGQMSVDEFVDSISEIESSKIQVRSYILKVKKIQKHNRVLKRKETIQKIKSKILGR